MALDLAVVGAGVSGTYVAARVARERPGWRIGLFERSSRVGGRLLSLRVDGLDHVRAELGAMRFRTSQPLVSSLVHELGLQTRPFATVFDDNRYLLRGARWRAGEPELATQVYDLADEERGRSPAELLLMAFERAVPGALELDEEGWRQVKRSHRFRGRLLRDWSLGDVLAACLGADGLAYVIDGFGYVTVLGERNAADAIPWVLIEARPEAENTTIVEGMERLARGLASRAGAAGVAVEHEREVMALDRADAGDGSGSITLRFRGSPDVEARRVVLALPAVALRSVTGDAAPSADPEARSLLDSVSPTPASKLFLVYESAWWRRDGLQGMRSVSDAALSKTYYFDFGLDPGPSTEHGPGLLLASYADGPNRDHWRSLADATPRARDDAPYDAVERWNSYAASPAQIEAAQTQLTWMHPDAEVPSTVRSAFVDWSDGAWHVWKAGVASWEIEERVVRPSPDVPVYVCNEAFSESQGWVEGALESAERVLDRILAAP